MELTENQNTEIIKLSTILYQKHNDNLESLGKKIVIIEEKMKKFEIKKDFSSNNENPNENKSLFKLEEEIKEIDENIKEKNFPITSLNKSINEDSDYITKISMEKKSIVDSIDENYIINLTYQDSFKHDYQYDLIMILLQEINKVRFENKIEEQFKKNDCPVSESIGLEMKNRIKKELIIQNFKVLNQFINRLLALMLGNLRTRY